MPIAAVRWCWLLFNGSKQLPVTTANMKRLPFHAYAVTAPLKIRSLTSILVIQMIYKWTRIFNIQFPSSHFYSSSQFPQLCLPKKGLSLPSAKECFHSGLGFLPSPNTRLCILSDRQTVLPTAWKRTLGSSEEQLLGVSEQLIPSRRIFLFILIL